MAPDRGVPLRVLIADERLGSLEQLADVVAGLGHEVVAREVVVAEVGERTSLLHPDVALVDLGGSSPHALDLIEKIVLESECPVIALMETREPAYVREAAKRGVFAFIVDASPDEVQSAIDVTLQRFAEYHDLRGAFGRRALIEQAKGILMERHAIDADAAFALLRGDSRRSGTKVSELAAAVVTSHGVMTSRRSASPPTL